MWLRSGAVEGIVDEAVLVRLISEAGGWVRGVYGKNGKSYLKRMIAGYNNAARFAPWFVLVDLDQDADCIPPFMATWIPNPAPLMRFRVAVKAVESWILADRVSVASFLRVAPREIPGDPDALANPKEFLVSLSRGSRHRGIREDMVPRTTSGRLVGPAYASRLIEFVSGRWRPDVAARASDSLRRCRVRLAELVIAAQGV